LDSDGDDIPRLDIGARENEGVTGVRFEPGEVLVWDAVSASNNLYRGDLAVLRATGVYTQDPGEVPGADMLCDIARPGFPYSEDPDPGQAFFYLIAIPGPVRQGPLGFASDGTARLSTYPDCTF
jgi:hypothetical protein